MKIKKNIESVKFITQEADVFLEIVGWAVDLKTKKSVDLQVVSHNNPIDVQCMKKLRVDVADEIAVALDDMAIGFKILIPIQVERLNPLKLIAITSNSQDCLLTLSNIQLERAYQQQSQLYIHVDTIIEYNEFYYFKGWSGDSLFGSPLHIQVIQNNYFLTIEQFKSLPRKNVLRSNTQQNESNLGFEFIVNKKHMTLDDIVVIGKNKLGHQKMVTINVKTIIDQSRKNIYLDNLYVLKDINDFSENNAVDNRQRTHIDSNENNLNDNTTQKVPITLSQNIIIKQSDSQKTEPSFSTLYCDGWVIIENIGNVVISLIDSNNNDIPVQVVLSDRPDLQMQDLLSPYDKSVGFSLQAFVQLDTTYTIVVSNGNTIHVKTITPKFIQNFNKQTQLQKMKQMSKRINRRNIKIAVDYYKMYGLKQTFYKAKHVLLHGNAQMDYMVWYEKNKATLEELKKQSNTQFQYSPKISIIVPTYKTPERYLREMIDSVLNQTYSNWELCIADGSQDGNVVASILEEYAQKDNRIKYIVLNDNLGISDNTNACLKLATGDYIGLFDHDDLLTPDALFEIVSSLQDVQHDVIYTDEDKVDETSQVFSGPHFKPIFSPDLLRSINYITHFFVVKKEIVNQIGGFDKTFDGAQDFDFILRCTEVAKSIHHVNKVLYHWRMHANSTAGNPESKRYAYEAGARAIESHLKRLNIKGSVKQIGFTGYQTTYEVVNNPKVSILIPSKDHWKTLDSCIQSILNQSYFTNYDIIIIENNSTEQQTFDYYKVIQKQDARIKVVVWEGIFNYSAINNFGATFATGDYLLLLNNDTEMLEPTALCDMVGTVIQEGIGAVGAKLLFEDKTIQHSGVILGVDNVPTHHLFGLSDKDKSYRHNALTNYLAVTGACLMTPKKVFDEVGGLSEEFVVAFNDIDYCLKVYQAGYRIVNNGFAKWLHYESKSRGYENTPEKQKRFLNEKNLFKMKWDSVFSDGDPYYNHTLPH